ncbi:MAG: hypothetical protein E7203_04425 [Selenomonas ruminantium]|uniref:Uncharacterized protein n=1 Tax=Selenomonas ruminantium TaxID=971 RepID=A0A927ZRV7_SELRU|nr:hypothetical protein [Selenomonas ruminantium]MBE6084701.1 hypothetical protein [Selenomonas ruminantium]
MDSRIRLFKRREEKRREEKRREEKRREEKNSDFIYWDIEQPSGVTEKSVTSDGCFCMHIIREAVVPFRVLLHGGDSAWLWL